MCTVTCKWNFLAHEKRWSAPYFQRVGLDEFVTENYARIGTDIVAPGSPVGAGLTEAAAHELGLHPQTPVGAALIDAHAGGIGAIGGRMEGGDPVNVAIGSPISWEPPPASWRQRPNRASCLVSGGLIIRAWCPVSGSTKVDSRPQAQRSITCFDRTPPTPRPSQPRAAKASSSSNSWKSGSLRRPRAIPAAPRRLRAIFTSCRSFSATGRLMPIPTRAP